MNWQQIKEIAGALVAVAVVVLAVGAAYMEWRIDSIVAAKIAAQDLATDSNIMSMNDEIDANAAGVLSNKERGELTQRQLEQVAQILMQPPE